ncbi:MAG: aminotransferase class III-fold pyridoxal phosphate-dependent enzyme, partial [Pseudomonadota bacterium]
GVVEHVRRIAPLFQEKLRRVEEHPLVGEARGVGLVGGIELSPDPASRATFAAMGKVGAKVSQEMLARGVIVRAIGDTVAFCPPMVIDEDGIEELFQPLEAALDAAWHWARAEGHLG